MAVGYLKALTSKTLLLQYIKVRSNRNSNEVSLCRDDLIPLGSNCNFGENTYYSSELLVTFLLEYALLIQGNVFSTEVLILPAMGARALQKLWLHFILTV